MKTVSFILFITLSMTSCTGGWKEEDRLIHRRACEDVMKYDYPDQFHAICDCYVDELIARHPGERPPVQQTLSLLDECMKTAGANRTGDVSNRDSVLAR